MTSHWPMLPGLRLRVWGRRGPRHAAGREGRGRAQVLRLVMLCNDVSLRNLIPGELAKVLTLTSSLSARPSRHHAR